MAETDFEFQTIGNPHMEVVCHKFDPATDANCAIAPMHHVFWYVDPRNVLQSSYFCQAHFDEMLNHPSVDGSPPLNHAFCKPECVTPFRWDLDLNKCTYDS